MSKIAGAVFNHIKDLRSFTTRDIASYFPAVPFNILKEAVKELWEANQITAYGEKRGRIYSVNSKLNETEQQEEEELSPKLIAAVEKFVLSKQDFTSSEVFTEFPNHPEHIVRKVLVYLRDDKGIIFLRGHGKASIWSQHEVPLEAPIIEEETSNDLKDEILKFAKTNLRWFKRSELDDIIDSSPYELRQALYSLMDDGEIQMRGERRTTEYAYCEVLDGAESITEEEEDQEIPADPELTRKILEHIIKVGVVTIPQLVLQLNETRANIKQSLKALENQEEIYHEGIKKSSKYIHKNITPTKADVIVKENRDEKEVIKEKAIDELSALLLRNSAVYVMYSNSSSKYELRCTNPIQGGPRIIFASEDPESVLNKLMSMTKGVEVELAV